MKAQIRHLIAQALYPTKAYSLPAVCERYGLEPGDEEEAFASKRQYVLRRLEKLSDEKVLQVANLVLQDFVDDSLQSAVETLSQSSQLISDITRRRLAEALNTFSLSGKTNLLEFLSKHWPNVHAMPSGFADTSMDLDFGYSVTDDIWLHAVRNETTVTRRF
jgi:hypothetical protein